MSWQAGSKLRLCVGAVRKALQRDAEARGAQSVGRGGQRVSPQRFVSLWACFSMRPCGRNGRDPTTEQMRCRGRRRRPRPAGPALRRVLSSHRGGTGPAAAFMSPARRADRRTASHARAASYGLRVKDARAGARVKASRALLLRHEGPSDDIEVSPEITQNAL